MSNSGLFWVNETWSFSVVSIVSRVQSHPHFLLRGLFYLTESDLGKNVQIPSKLHQNLFEAKEGTAADLKLRWTKFSHNTPNKSHMMEERGSWCSDPRCKKGLTEQKHRLFLSYYMQSGMWLIMSAEKKQRRSFSHVCYCLYLFSFYCW